MTCFNTSKQADELMNDYLGGCFLPPSCSANHSRFTLTSPRPRSERALLRSSTATAS